MAIAQLPQFSSPKILPHASNAILFLSVKFRKKTSNLSIIFYPRLITISATLRQWQKMIRLIRIDMKKAVLSRFPTQSALWLSKKSILPNINLLAPFANVIVIKSVMRTISIIMCCCDTRLLRYKSFLFVQAMNIGCANNSRGTHYLRSSQKTLLHNKNVVQGRS